MDEKKKVVLNAMHEADLQKILSEGLPEMQYCIKCGDPIKSPDDIVDLQIKRGKPHPICVKHKSFVWSNASEVR